jgi:hypothetical protein
MKSAVDERSRILLLMSDGQHRTYDDIRLKALMDSETLRDALHGMVFAGLLDRDYTRGSEAYVITLAGLVTLRDSAALTPLYWT